MRCGTFDFIQNAAHVRNDDQAQLFARAGAQAARFPESSEEAIESKVLAEEKKFVLSLEVVVEIGGREVSGGGDVAHTSFGKAGNAKLISGGAQDFQAAGEVAPRDASMGSFCAATIRQGIPCSNVALRAAAVNKN
jgi:hypothetical protein